ncbi:MAG: acyltransferase [Lysobacteraceae bacterium]|nr:MAG: acyltransferase [Xanthomonadaceae bacterium]
MTDWKSTEEAGSAWAFSAFVWVARRFGRRLSRLVLRVVSLYFWLVRGEQRRQIAAFREVVTGQKATAMDTLRHFWTFAQVALDRLYLLMPEDHGLQIEAEGLGQMDSALALERGCLLLGAHFGSFEAARLIAGRRPEIPLRALMDLRINARVSAVLERINPQLSKQVLDVQDMTPTEVALSLKQALDQKAMVAMLADRTVGRDRSLTVEFFGRETQFPASPWWLAKALDVPVVMFTAVLTDGKYKARFERVDRPVLIDPAVGRSAARQQLVEQWAQDFAGRLEARVRQHPDNWFNFYSFWESR